MSKHAAAAVLAALISAGALAAEGEPGRAKLIEEDWALAKISGQPAGYAHMRVLREVRDGKAHIITVADERIGITRMGVTIRVEEKASFTELETGEPVSFRTEQLVSQQRKVTEGVVKGDELELTITVMGRSRKITVPWDPANRFSYAIEKEVKKLKRPGDELSVKTYLPEMGSVTLRLVARGPETVEVAGKPTELFRTDITGAMPGITIREYRDSEGDVVKSVTPAAGLELVTERCDRETALRLGSAAAGVDMVAETFVRPNIPLPHPKRLEGCTYRLTFHSGRLEEVDLGADERQEILRQEMVDGKLVVDLRVRKVGPGGGIAAKAPDAKYLASSSNLQADDPEIIRFAQRVTADIDEPYAKAKALERWVYRSINKKSFEVGFATAKEVMRTRAGDCTEHAVLLAAMLRAVGIPAKASAGLVYFKGIFGYHMWAECWVGRWVALDATLAKPFVDATHIEFSESELGDESPMKSFASVIGQVAGKVDMEILDFTVDGRMVKVAALGEVHMLEDGVYTDKLNALSFRLPGGWRLVPKKDRSKSLAFATAVFENTGGPGRIKVEVIGPPYDFSFVMMPLMLARRYSVVAQETNRIAGRPALVADYTGRGGRPSYSGLFVLDDDVLISIIGQDLGAAGPATFRGIARGLKFIRPAWAGGAEH